MKKMFAILTLLLAFGLAACGQKNTAPETTQPTETAEAAASTEPEAEPSEAVEPETEPSEPPETEAALSEAAETQEAAPSEAAQDETPTGVWYSITEEQVRERLPLSFRLPEGAEQAEWTAMEPEDDYFGLRGTLVQVTFVLDGLSYTAREQITQDTSVDISDLDYNWTIRLDSALSNWGSNPPLLHSSRYLDESGYVDLCTWYDWDNGISYSLTVSAPDLDGFDLQAVVEAMAPDTSVSE